MLVGNLACHTNGAVHLFRSCKSLRLQEEIGKGHQDKEAKVGEQRHQVPQTCRKQTHTVRVGWMQKLYIIDRQRYIECEKVTVFMANRLSQRGFFILLSAFPLILLCSCQARCQHMVHLPKAFLQIMSSNAPWWLLQHPTALSTKLVFNTDSVDCLHDCRSKLKCVDIKN